MSKITKFKSIVPVIPSADIERDLEWYNEKTGFETLFADKMYAALRRDNLTIHLQWHANTKEDPLLGGSVIRIFVKNIQPLFNEYVKRGTVKKDELRLKTVWDTNEFGFYDLNSNALFFVEDIA